jgi:16S rRNA (cytosine967-C5)-methyltransferase
MRQLFGAKIASRMLPFEHGEAGARAIAQAHLQEAPLDISVQSNRPGRDLHDWAATLDAEVLPSGSLRRMKPGPVEMLPGYDEGGWWVQDAAAALPVAVLARLPGGALQGRTVADLCAAPGGKTAQLASLGAAVTAIDRSESRLQRLKANLDRLRLMASVVCADVEAWLPAETFDAVLLDAPCSATGTIRRHPDLPHLKSEADIAKLSQLQRRLIAHAWTILEPGGYLIYCVCSLQPEEGEAQLETLRALPRARLQPLSAADFGLPDQATTQDGCLRTLPSFWPERGGMDGFFIAAVRKET